ncbi:carnitine dehydratase [Streptacidiphilus sp. PB12-B1b]|uniref:CoA transferase n=1 Tax=Streptacidiphilus sp. PB12-B1b TaxID=2705012 RepID=UPI0015FD7A7B|nr:CoA transferase [Streptacidiphilus sp. PB12-B1b]QMU77746.1 carnitine dehydratase [Streptacidiphilus sp. PB12-B1b]
MLTERLTAALAHRATGDGGFDPHAELAGVLSGIGLRPQDCGGSVTFRGADPIVPSVLRLGAAAGIALVAKSVAVAALWQQRGGPGQDVGMDLRVAPHRLCPFYERKWELLGGYPAGSASNPSLALTFMYHRTGDDRWVMPFNAYPKLKVAAQTLLGVPDETGAVARAIGRWKAAELEQAAAAAGVVLPMLRTTEELLAEDHYREVLAGLPLVEVVRIGDSEPEPFRPGAAAPLDGIRALGMGHVIAGAGAGRALALHGADVLNLWRPDELEHDVTYISANVGLRSALLDPTGAEESGRLRELLGGADVFFANRRPGYLDRIGLSAQAAADVRPGIVHATVSLNGETGPWADRIGFDQTAGCLTGMMLLEGAEGLPGLPPTMVVNDYIVAWLLTAGIVQALRRRAVEGGSYRVHVSLTRAALWIIGLGLFDREYAHGVAGSGGDHAYPDPETFTARTPLGVYQGVTDQVRMSQTPGAYRQVLLPRGSCPAEWLPRD